MKRCSKPMGSGLKQKGRKGEKPTCQGPTSQGLTSRGPTWSLPEALSSSQVRDAGNWQLAFYSFDVLTESGLPYSHNEGVKKKLAEMEKKEKASGAR